MNPPSAPGVSAARPVGGLHVAVVGVALPMETFVDRLLTGLARRGVALTVVSRESPPSDWLRSRGARWRFGPGARGRRNLVPLARRHGAKPVLETLGRRAVDLAARRVDAGDKGWTAGALADVDIVYAPWINHLVQCPELLDAGLPVVASCRGRMITADPWHPDHPDRAAALRKVFTAVDRVHCVSRAILEDATAFGLDEGRAEVITPAVDPDMFSPSAAPRPPGPIRVVATGSLTWLKDYETALRGVRRALDMGADLHYSVVGIGPERDHFLFTAGELGLRDRVTLLGRQPPAEVLSHLRGADVMLHTSSTEGISNAVLEAMACGLAVVTTDSGGMAEVVDTDVNGMLVGVRDSDAIGTALHRLAGDVEARARLGTAARHTVVDRFGLDRQVDAFAALLARTAGGR